MLGCVTRSVSQTVSRRNTFTHSTSARNLNISKRLYWHTIRGVSSFFLEVDLPCMKLRKRAGLCREFVVQVAVLVPFPRQREATRERERGERRTSRSRLGIATIEANSPLLPPIFLSPVVFRFNTKRLFFFLSLFYAPRYVILLVKLICLILLDIFN